MTTTTFDTSLRNSRDTSCRFKRPLDVSICVVLLICGWPIFLLIALVDVLTSPGPIFFLQTRVGKRGRTFRMVKFRSMYEDAEKWREDVEKLSDRDGVCLKVRRDPRITPVGRVLRRCSLDELPQLFNVLRGEMSLVGPRPALVNEVAAYPEHAHKRHDVLPGITGLWQVSGRADIGFDEMIDMDLEYVRRVSFLTDMMILVRTIKAVFTGRGAY